MKILGRAAIFLCTTLLSGLASATPTTYDSIVFPDGDISFADYVVRYSPGSDVGAGWNDSSDALGAPDDDAVSLGDLGELIVQFTDNSLTASGNSDADLHIFEIGSQVEDFKVSISTNSLDWIEIGELRGQPTSIDIDPVSGVIFGESYSFVRLQDLTGNQTGSPYGEADIDAIGAISSAAPVPDPTPAPEPATITLLLMGLLGIGLLSGGKRSALVR